MPRTLLPLAIALLAAACRQHHVRGTDYRFPVPAGFVEYPPSELPAGALAVRQRDRVAPDYFLASIVVTPIAPSTPPFNPTDPSLCAQVAQAVSRQQNAAVMGSGIVATPIGSTCQYDVQSSTSQQASRGIVMHGPRSMWMLTCNHDPRDGAALTACQSVVDGWRFL